MMHDAHAIYLFFSFHAVFFSDVIAKKVYYTFYSITLGFSEMESRDSFFFFERNDSCVKEEEGCIHGPLHHPHIVIVTAGKCPAPIEDPESDFIQKAPFFFLNNKTCK